MERKPNKSQHTKLILEKKILPLLLQRFEPATFRSRVQRSYQQAIAATEVAGEITKANDQCCVYDKKLTANVDRVTMANVRV